MVRDVKLMFEEGTPLEKVSPLQSLIEIFYFIKNMGQDISYIVQFLSQFLCVPTLNHHNAA